MRIDQYVKKYPWNQHKNYTPGPSVCTQENILAAIGNQALTSMEIAQAINAPRLAHVHHMLTKLRRAGLVTREKLPDAPPTGCKYVYECVQPSSG